MDSAWYVNAFLGAMGTLRACGARLGLGRRGGLKGGKARAAKMTPEQRSESARKAAKARWAKKPQQEESS
jgi:hypothetical protein